MGILSNIPSLFPSPETTFERAVDFIMTNLLGKLSDMLGANMVMDYANVAGKI